MGMWVDRWMGMGGWMCMGVLVDGYVWVDGWVGMGGWVCGWILDSDGWMDLKDIPK